MGGPVYLAISAVLVAVQIALLALIARPFFVHSPRVRTRYFNPANWFVGFYSLWFILPQFYLLAPPHRLVGFDEWSSRSRLVLAVTTQGYLIAFLLAVGAGCFLFVRNLRSIDPEAVRPLDHLRGDTPWRLVYALVLLACGIAANKVLGDRWAESEEFRSMLVKSTDGMALTVVAFAGAYGFANVFSRLLVTKRYVIAAVVLIAFAAPIFFTGARARMVWPVLIAIAFSMTRQNAISWSRLALGGVFVGAVLLYSDRFLTEYRRGYVESKTVSESVIEVMERRNFDGFANFTMSVNHFPGVRPHVFWTGARDEFMNTFFPDIYARGVGTGATVPSVGWIGGKLPGLLGVGFAFGLSLGLLDLFVRRIESTDLYWAYLFAMPWHCAIGGNYLEAADKMLAAMAPALAPWFLVTFFPALRASGPPAATTRATT